MMNSRAERNLRNRVKHETVELLKILLLLKDKHTQLRLGEKPKLRYNVSNGGETH